MGGCRAPSITATWTRWPRSGWARRRGGLSASDFVKCISVQKIDSAGFRSLAGDVQELARAEGLLAHVNAVEVRK